MRNTRHEDTFVRTSDYQLFGLFVCGCGVALVVIAVVGCLNGHARDLGYLPGALLFAPIGIGTLTARVTCDTDGLRYRLFEKFRFRTIRVQATEIAGITVQPYRSGINGRKVVFLVVERKNGTVVRLARLSRFDNTEGRRVLEADAATIRKVIGLPTPSTTSTAEAALSPQAAAQQEPVTSFHTGLDYHQ